MKKMRNFYNQKTSKIEQFEPAQILTFEFAAPDTWSFSFFKDLDKEMERFIGDIMPTNEPILFRLKTDLTQYRTDEELSVNDFALSVIGVFMSHLFTNIYIDLADQRLTPPPSLEKAFLTVILKKDLHNRILKYPVIAVDFIDSDQLEIEVF